MKQLAIILLAIFFVSSCIQKHENLVSDRTEVNIAFDTTWNAGIEKNLRKQLSEYLKAFSEGDPEKAISYCYPDMFTYIKQQHPNDYSLEEVRESFMESTREIERMSKDEGMTFKFQIGAITERIDLGADKIYVISASIIAEKNLDKISMGDEVVAITNDGGENWTFLQKDTELTPSVLKIKFSDGIVRRVMASNKTDT